MNENRKQFIPGQPVADEDRCQALSRQSGQRCKLRRIPPSKFCKFHGGQNVGGPGNRQAKGVPKGTPKPPGSGRGAPKGSARAMTTGVATTKMPAHLVELRETILAGYMRDVEAPNFADSMALGRAASIEAKFQGAIEDPDCPASTLDTLHRILHRELRALKATREMREQTATGTSPAEVVAAILVKVAERRRQVDEGHQVEAQRPAAAMSTPGRRATVIDVDPGCDLHDIAEDVEDAEAAGDLDPPPVETAEVEAADVQTSTPDPEPEQLGDDEAEVQAPDGQADDGDDGSWPW